MSTKKIILTNSDGDGVGWIEVAEDGEMVYTYGDVSYLSDGDKVRLLFQNIANGPIWPNHPIYNQSQQMDRVLQDQITDYKSNIDVLERCRKMIARYSDTLY